MQALKEDHVTNKFEPVIYRQLSLFMDELQCDDELLSELEHESNKQDKSLINTIYEIDAKNHESQVAKQETQSLAEHKKVDGRIKSSEGPDLPEFGSMPECLDDGAYLELGIAVLEVCASDLHNAQKCMAEFAEDTLQYRRSKAMRDACVRWLYDAPTETEDSQVFVSEDVFGGPVELISPGLPFSICVKLLEEELRYRTGKENIPEMWKNREKLANFILKDPQQAQYIFSRYSRLFARDGMPLGFESEDDFSTGLEAIKDEALIEQSVTQRERIRG